MTENQTTALIVGAGPTGLTLACELARSGVSCRLIEASAGPQLGSRGKGLQPRTLEVFDDLGIVGRVIANGRMAMPTRRLLPMAASRYSFRGLHAPVLDKITTLLSQTKVLYLPSQTKVQSTIKCSRRTIVSTRSGAPDAQKLRLR